ncbi:MAG TPA: DUF1206 domain-containing protein [Gemmatimonadales bacterium]|nr:DUF1206 domain-containing protein [Gemmatimonadales bacterium]
MNRVAQLGFAAKGLVAIMIGALALRLALGSGGGDLAGPGDALREFFSQPFGWFILAVIALGLWAHALWKLAQALLDPERKGTSLTALAERIAFFVTALGYAALGIAAVQLLFGYRVAGTTSPQELAALLLTPHVGRWATGLVGVIIVVSGVLQIRFGLTAGFRHVLRLDEMGATARTAVALIGGAGYLALGVISLIIGYFLIRVALLYDPTQARGWGQALGFLADLRYGRWALGVVAAGLICYGLYFIFLILYRVEIY